MIKLLQKIDQFGVTFQSRIQYSISHYKTNFGGAMSIILYGLSLAYLIYIIIQWRTGQILPKITTSSKVENNEYFELNEKFVEVELRKFGYSNIDPFNPNALILQPLLYVFKNGIPLNKPLVPIYQITTKEDKFHLISFSNLSLSISEMRDQIYPEYEVMLTFGTCLQNFVQEGQTCANETIIEQFKKQSTNTLIVKYFAKEFNTKTENLEIIGREQIIPLQSSKVFQTQTYIQITKTSVDVGMLLESKNEYKYINEYRVVGSTLDLEYYNEFFGYNVYIAFLYKIDNIQIEISIVYTKISEILAEAGSIASTLLLLSNLVIFFNKKQLEFETINNVIQIYYPEIKNTKITRNIFGQIKKVEKNGKQLDLQSFNKYYQKLSHIGEIKLTIFNQIYEISRLQFLLQNLLPSKTIQQIHHQGIPFQFQYTDSNKEEEQSNINKIDYSINQDYQYKFNTIIPNNISPPNIKSNDVQTISQTEQKLIQSQQKLLENNLNTQVQQLKDSDFDLLIQPKSELQFNQLSNHPDTIIQSEL